ncbi:restriction endonuclease subunit S [Macrococcoides bohemicum]|uniref:restriction endonuclease subunit S n=1 Tax=Macrococcoides bohemicum TaxID=1903056 RepID=UPI003B00A5A6
MSREMKDSGVEWIGEIPKKSWQVKKVKTLFDIGRGRVISKEELDEKKKYPVYSSQTKNNGILGYINTYDFDEPLLTWTTDGANAGTIFLRTGKFNCTNVCGTLKLKLSEEFDIDFLFFTLYIGAPNYKRRDTNGYKIMNNEMAEIQIPIPDIDTQKRISLFINNKIKHIESLIMNTQKSIEDLKKYKQSLITEVVTKGLDKNVEMKDSGIEWIGEIPKDWEVIKTKYRYKTSKGLTITKDNLQDEGIPVLNYGEIHSKYPVRFNPLLNPVKFVSEDFIVNKNALLKYGDLIFADTSEDIEGSGNFTCFLGEGLCFAGYHTVVLKPNLPMNPIFMSYLFDSLTFRKQVRNLVQGIKVYSITQNILRNTYIWLPPLEEQDKIAKYLESKIKFIDNLVNEKQKVINEYESYKKSLIYEYVTGKKEVGEEVE